MYNANKSLSIWALVVGLVIFLLTIFHSPAVADENYGNVPPDANMWVNPEKFPAIVSMAMTMGDSVIIKIT
jgi:hypothetical protein